MRGEVARWLEELSSDAYEVRERARAALMLHGGRARDLLEARREDPDPEVRRGVRAVLDRLSPQAVEATPKGPAVDVATVGTVTLDVRGTLPEVLRKLGQGHDASFDLPAGHDAKEAEAHAAGEPLFRVLDLIAGGAGLDASAPFDPSGTLTLREATQGGEPVPTAYAGPLRARVVRVTTVRTLGAQPTRTYSLGISLNWSPDIQVVSLHSPVLKAAEDAEGRAYRLPGSGGGVVTYGIGSTSTSTEVSLSLTPAAPEAGDRLARLEIGVPLRVRHGRKWVTLRNVKDLPRTLPVPPEMTGGAQGGSVTLRRLEAPEHPGGTYVVEVTAQLDSEVARESARAYLEAADGSLTALGLSARSTSSDGTVEMVGRGRFSGSVGPTAVRVSWFVREGDGEVPFRLEGIPLR